MRKIYLLVLLFFIFSLSAQAQYVTVWKTDAADTPLPSQITIPATGTNYSIQWEEVGNPDNNGTLTGSGNQVVQFPSPGTYQVSISAGNGSFSRITFAQGADRNKLLEIRQWGDTRWESMENAYQGCTNLTITATDIPDLQAVTSMSGMFESCATITDIPNINQWYTGNVTNMSRLFHYATKFNAPIGDWQVGNVTDMTRMFHTASAFNQPIGNWFVDRVTSMNAMFQQAYAFNQPLESWDVREVTNMQAMFSSASAFNQPLKGWTTERVTNMSFMFYQAGNFNQPIEKWDVAQVRNMSSMFVSATRFDQPLGQWNLASVTNMTSMLLGSGMQCASMTLSLQGWADNPATPANISLGANGRPYGTQAVPALDRLRNEKNWTIAIGTEVTCALPATPLITTWVTHFPGSSAENELTISATGTNYLIEWRDKSDDLIYGSTIASGPATLQFPSPGVYEVSISPGGGTLTAVSFGSSGDAAKLYEINQWGNNKWTSLENAFSGAVNLYSAAAQDMPDLGNTTSTSRMFAGCTSIYEIPGIEQWSLNNVTNTSGMFDGFTWFVQDVSGWNMGNVTNTSRMFANTAYFNQPIGNWNVANVTNMAEMFEEALYFNQDISGWNVGKVTNMTGLFRGAIEFDQPIGSWNVGNVTTMEGMFSRTMRFNQLIGSWNMTNVTNVRYMFSETFSFDQPLENWNTSKIEDMTGLFSQALSFNQPLEGWNVSNVKSMNAMFSETGQFNQPLAAWDVSHVTDMHSAFLDTRSFNQSLGSWNLRSVTDMTSMLDNSDLDCKNMTATLEGWAANPDTPNNVTFGAAGIAYGNSAGGAVDVLLNTKGWTIELGEEVDCEALDVTLISFRANTQNGTVVLNWATADETNNDYFEVERSADARRWEKVSQVKGAGTVATLRNYQSKDANPLAGNSYYRLKIIDFAGKADYSNIVSVRFEHNTNCTIYPNPATSNLTVSGAAKGEAKIFNTTGRAVFQTQLTGEKQRIALDEIPPGMFILKTDDGCNVRFLKR